MPASVRNQRPPYILNSSDLSTLNSQQQEALGKISDDYVAAVAGATTIPVPDNTDLQAFDTEQQEVLLRALAEVRAEYDDVPPARLSLNYAAHAFNVVQVVTLQNALYKLTLAMADAVP